MPTPPRQQTTPHSALSAILSAPSALQDNADAITDVFRILTCAAVGMAALLALFPPVGHDQLWCLYVAQRMLAGAHLYGPELFESNPPLIMWASLGLAHIAQSTHIPITVLFKLAVCGVQAASALLSFSILRRLHPDRMHPTRWTWAFAYIVIFAVMPARDFGQRDHLLAILCLPYVLAAAMDAATTRKAHVSPLRTGDIPTPARVLIGLAAGLGLCLKPHNTLIVFTTEVLLLAFAWKRKPSTPAFLSQTVLRPELLTLTATGLIYLAAVHDLTPEYLTQIVPLLRDVYWAIGHLTPLQLAQGSIQLHVLAVITIGLYLKQSQRQAEVTFLIAAGLASTAAYYLQGTGWYYQQIPALSFFATALVLQAQNQAQTQSQNRVAQVRLFHRLTWGRVAQAAALTLTLVALILTAHFTNYPFLPSRPFPIEAPDDSFFTNLPPGTPVAILTTSVDDTVMPTAKYHLLWAQRTNNLWILPALLRNESGPRPHHIIPAARLAELETLQHRFMVEDLNRWHPALILINRCQDQQVHCQVIEDRHDDLLAWFNRDPAFRAAFSPYHYTQSIGDFAAYTLR